MNSISPVLYCSDCKKKVRTIMKMGGLLCARCRVIIKDPYTKEFKEALQKIREKNASK